MTSSLIAFSPEILLTVCALGLVVLDAFAPGRKDWIRWFALASIAAMMAVAGAVAMNPALAGLHFGDALRLDAYTTFARLLFGAAGVLVVLASWDFYAERSVAEYFALFMLSLVGEVVIVAGTSLLMLFIGIELLAIPTYALVALLKQQETAVEAGLKYFLLGMFASVVMLYGTALLYGALGTIDYAAAPLFRDPKTLATGALGLVLFGFFFMMMGVGFKIVAFPFHFWSPDVYAGGSTPVVAYISTVPKVAIVLALFRILGPGFSALWPTGRVYLAVLAVLSMVYGNVVALMQDDVRRMLAYSGVANTGYMLVALAAGGADSYGALLFFLVVYTFTNLGAFFVVLAVSGQRQSTLDDFSGLSQRGPFLAFVMAVFMFSLAGTPPLSGFFGKFAMFRAAVVHGYWWLALIALLASVVSVGYYLKVAQAMYGGEPALSAVPGAQLGRVTSPLPLRVALALTCAATLLLGVFGVRLMSGF